jgi:hypothetical protein
MINQKQGHIRQLEDNLNMLEGSFAMLESFGKPSDANAAPQVEVNELPQTNGEAAKADNAPVAVEAAE